MEQEIIFRWELWLGMSRFSKFIKGNNRLLRNRLLSGVGVDFSRHHGFNKNITQFSETSL